jgi:hypothetical protein
LAQERHVIVNRAGSGVRVRAAAGQLSAVSAPAPSLSSARGAVVVGSVVVGSDVVAAAAVERAQLYERKSPA